MTNRGEHALPDLPPFRPRAPWWGGHLQTLRNKLIRHDVSLSGHQERLYFETSDGSGDHLTAVLDTPYGTVKGPMVVLIHGLAGSENSDYVRLSAAFHLKCQRRVLRLNLRGAGPSRRTCGGQYHSGSAPDIHDALSGLDKQVLGEGLFIVGFSLGGNLLVHLLGTHAENLPIHAAVAVSPAIDPAAAARRLMAPQNVFYHRWLLKRMQREATCSRAHLSANERQAILDAKSIYEFDDAFTAPRNGFLDADDYYARTAGKHVLANIRIPTLMLQARNDPWIPFDTYETLRNDLPAKVSLVLPASGGHVGFHGQGNKESWYDLCSNLLFKKYQ